MKGVAKLDEFELNHDQIPKVCKCELEIISTTLHYQREHYCAKLIQQAWRNKKAGKSELALTSGTAQLKGEEVVVQVHKFQLF